MSMTVTSNGAWAVYPAWTARRLVLSVLLLFQVGSTVLWCIPECPIRKWLTPYAKYYVIPTGQWQSWAMFAPDPMRDSITAEAEVIDKNGMRYAFQFPKLADFNRIEGIVHFRFSKYTANLAGDEFRYARECAARHVLRRMNLAEDLYPLTVHLFYQMQITPAPGDEAAASSPTKPVKPYVLGTYRFDSPKEVRR